MNATDWLTAFAEKLGTAPPSSDEFKSILDLAAQAAHASERVAAPAACWVAASARADLTEALAKAKQITQDG